MFIQAPPSFMLSADQQEEIIRANRQAFEELARSWRDPQNGSPRPDLKQAIINMVCDYFSAPGYGSEQLLKLISALYAAGNEEDERPPIELTLENQLPDQIRAVLKRLLPLGVTPEWAWDDGEWAWDDGEWDWELLVRDTVEDVDCGYVAIVPLKNGRRFEHRIKPPPSHQEWALRFVCDYIDIAIRDILIRGSLHQAKRQLDLLLGINTPEIEN